MNQHKKYYLPAMLMVFLMALCPAWSWARSMDNDAFISMLYSNDPAVQIEGARGLENLGIKSTQKAVQPLIYALGDRNKDVRLSALGALGALKWNAQSAVPALILKLQDKDKDIREAAALALENIGNVAGMQAVKDYRAHQKAEEDMHPRFTEDEYGVPIIKVPSDDTAK